MAKLPDVTAFGERPQVQLPRRTPIVADYRPTTGLEGAAAETMAHMGADWERTAAIVADAKEKADVLAAEDAYNKLKNAQLDLTYGQNGFMNLKGADAVNRDVPTQYGVQLRDAAKALSDGLGNDYQKQLFAKRAANAQLQMQEQAYHHVAQQSDQYANDVLQGTLDTESRVAAAGGDVPTSLVRMNAAIDRHAQRFGMPEQEVTSLKMKAADSLWSAQIKSTINTDPVRAQAIYKAHEAEIGPVNRVVLQHELNTAIRPIEAKLAAEFVLKAPQTVEFQKVMDTGGEPLINSVMRQDQSQPVGAKLTGGNPDNVRDTRAMLATWVNNAESVAQRLHPNDPVFRDMVVTQVKGYVSTIVAAQEGKQRQDQGTLLSYIAGQDGKPKPTTLDELFARPGAREAWAGLDPGALAGMNALLQHNQVEAMGGVVKSDPRMVKSLFDRIHADDSDPRKITSPSELAPFFAKGVSRTDYDWLKQEIDQQNSVVGRSFTADLNKVRNSAHSMLVRSNLGAAFPDKAEEASYRFNADLQTKVDQYRKDGKDPRLLLTPGTPDYVLAPEKVASYLPSGKQAIAQQAAGQYEKGKTYTFRQGKLEFLGGDPTDQKNWRAAK